jgi:hypothetical protein
VTAIVHIESMRPEPRRDEYGRYLLPDPRTGREQSWTRATTIAHIPSDDYQITLWKRRMVAEGLAKRPELLADVLEQAKKIAESDNWRVAKVAKDKLNELCDDAARAAGAEDGSKLGTLLHTISEYDDAGRISEIADQVPAELWPDVEAYRNTMDDAGILRPAEFIERIVVNTTVESGGTLDRLLRLRDGRLVVGDLKTQKTVDFGFLEIAIQLAEYAYADAMLDPDTGGLVPLPDDLDKSIGIVMHLPVGQGVCTLYELDLIAGWEAARTAYDVQQDRKRSKAMGRPYNPEARPATAPVEHTSVDTDLYLIRSATHPDALTALWRDLSSRGCWTELHTQTAATRKAQLLAS